ncbi:MAG: hypothetical protein WCK49_09290 [Myxococcaceae bacterium]
MSALYAGEPSAEDTEVLKALLAKYQDFQSQSYFLGIHPSWLEALVASESVGIQEAFKQQNPVLMQVLKTKLTRMSQQDNLLETGQRELAAYLVKAGRAKTVKLLAKLPADQQESVLTQLAKAPQTVSSEFELEFIFEIQYSNSSDLFKEVGLYCKDPSQINELAQRLEYAQGQKIIALLKK